MAYVTPQFNLECTLYTSNIVANLRLDHVPCNLAFSKRVQIGQGIGDPTFALSGVMFLLLPVGTDVRGPLNATGSDGVECPRGSGRWYVVGWVDDVGKGFPNEHRCAVLYQALVPPAGSWPTPIP